MILSSSRTKRRQAKEAAKSDDLSGRLVTMDTSALAAEDYRTLRTSLMYALVDEPPRLIMATSPGPMEG